MAKLNHEIEYLFIRLGVGLVNLLSARVADSFAHGLGSLSYRLLKSRRVIAADNLRQAFGDKYKEEEIDRIVRAVFQNIARTAIELARFRRLSLEMVSRMVIPEEGDRLKEAKATGKGVVAVTAHFGNWELLGGWVVSRGHPIKVLSYEQHNHRVYDLVVNLRRHLDIGLITLGKDSLKDVFRELKRNDVIGIVADQHAPAQSLVMDFFDRPAAVARGPALFAIRTGCPIVPYLMRRERYDRHVIETAPPIFPPNSGDEEKDIREMTARYLKFFESTVKKYPDQWMWTHRRWKI
jgi:KDO2-lipid IV(A) lauroyltransferase